MVSDQAQGRAAADAARRRCRARQEELTQRDFAGTLTSSCTLDLDLQPVRRSRSDNVSQSDFVTDTLCILPRVSTMSRPPLSTAPLRVSLASSFSTRVDVSSPFSRLSRRSCHSSRPVAGCECLALAPHLSACLSPPIYRTGSAASGLPHLMLCKFLQ